jgi:MarR family transcriptional regulator, organic hydroperoxide resistance regulator
LRWMGTAGESKQAVATEVWRLMSEFTFAGFRTSEHVGILRKMGLTPGHLKALVVLDPDLPRPMRALADALSCDASMVTWLVDRLEQNGLVERLSSPSDRRVKTLVLTPKGIELRGRLRDAMSAPPAELLGLDMRSLRVLREELAKLPRPGRTPLSDTPKRAEPASRAGSAGSLAG